MPHQLTPNQLTIMPDEEYNAIERFHPVPEDHLLYLKYMACAIRNTRNYFVIQDIMASVGGYLTNVSTYASGMHTDEHVSTVTVSANQRPFTYLALRRGSSIELVKPIGPSFPDVSTLELADLDTCGEEELGALFSVYFYAIGKYPRAGQLQGFNECRRAAVRALANIDELSIFVDESTFLTAQLLLCIHESFKHLTHIRMAVLDPIVRHLDSPYRAAGAVFVKLFALNAGYGLSIFYMTNLTISIYPNFIEIFPELTEDLLKVSEGLHEINMFDPEIREYCKYIMGSELSTLKLHDVPRLLSVLAVTTDALFRQMDDIPLDLNMSEYQERARRLVNGDL